MIGKGDLGEVCKAWVREGEGKGSVYVVVAGGRWWGKGVCARVWVTNPVP